jgi:hypothetical protein
MKKYRAKNFFRKNTQLFFAAALCFVIGLHTIRFVHDHQKEIFGGGAEVIMHGSDKKHFFVADASIFNASFAALFTGFFAAYVLFSSIFLSRRIFDPFREALRRGIIHPKLYSR